MFRNIIWDLDGTLFDTYPAIARAVRAALNDLGKDASLERIDGLARNSLSHCVRTLASQCQLNEDDLGQAFERHYDRTPLEEQTPFPGVIAVCEYICRLDGMNLIVTHRGRTSTNELLDIHRMTHYFASCISRDDGYPRKPHPAAFEAALNAHNLRREETMAVGDREIDILAGRAAGIFTCLFAPHSNNTVADLNIHSFDELYVYLVSRSSQHSVADRQEKEQT